MRILDLSSFHPLPQCVCMLHYAEDFPRNLEHANANLSLNGANGA